MIVIIAKQYKTVTYIEISSERFDFISLNATQSKLRVYDIQ